MPITYYTQEEVDELINKARENGNLYRDKVNSFHGRLIIRSWILYWLFNVKDNKKKRDELIFHFMSLDQIEKDFPNMEGHIEQQDLNADEPKNPSQP